MCSYLYYSRNHGGFRAFSQKLDGGEVYITLGQGLVSQTDPRLNVAALWPDGRYPFLPVLEEPQNYVKAGHLLAVLHSNVRKSLKAKKAS